MTNAGSRPAAWSIHARSEEVVVLPWVPTTMSACRPAATKRFTAWGIEQKASPSRSSSTASGFVAGDRVAHDHQVRPVRQVLGPEPVEHAHPALGEKAAHRGVDLLVGAGHLQAEVLEQAGERAHGGAADRDQVDAADVRGDEVAGHVHGGARFDAVGI